MNMMGMLTMEGTLIVLKLLLISVAFIFVRSVYLIRSIHQQTQKSVCYSPDQQRLRSCALTVLLGSGGHTAEMIRLLSALPFDRYTPRTYLISSGDSLSKSHIIRLEKFRKTGHYTFYEIPRARRVNQSFMTSVFTTSYSLVWCLWLITIKPFFDSLYRSKQAMKNSNEKVDYPVGGGMILLNGPGSAVPIGLSAFFSKLLTGHNNKTCSKLVYVESLARVQRLSFTGLVLLPFVDCFVVQWKTLYDIIHQSRLYKFFHRFKLVPPITFDGWMV